MNLKKLLKCLKAGNEALFRDWYSKTLEGMLKCLEMGFVDFWSKAVAGGFGLAWEGRRQANVA